MYEEIAASGRTNTDTDTKEAGFQLGGLYTLRVCAHAVSVVGGGGW